MHTFLIVIQVLLALGIIGLVLLQQGRGADVGAAFGSGASGTVFGARGSANFLSRTTAVLAALFFANSLILAYLVSERPEDDASVVQEAPAQPPAPPAPAAPVLPEAPDAAQ
jgi:preprotein translocase subunit SecG